MSTTPQQEPQGQLFDADQALRFLELLGKDPATTYFRLLGCGPNKPSAGRDRRGFQAEQLEAANRQNRCLYAVIGNSTTASGNAGGVVDADIAAVPAFFVEWDEGPIDWQLNAWRELELPEPTLMVSTGGKSIHAYWVLQHPLEPEQWRSITKRLIAHCGSDPQCCNPSRVMRLPGGAYRDKKTGELTGNRAEIVEQSGRRYALEHLLQCLPPPPQRPAAAAAAAAPSSTVVPFPRRDDLPPRSVEAIEAAAAFVPERVAGGNTYEVCRRALCGCAAALEEAGMDPAAADEMALDLLATKWPDRGTAQQALESSTTRKAAAFWAIAREGGYSLSRNDLVKNHQIGKSKTSTAQPAAKAKRKPRPLSRKKARYCFQRCVQVLAKRERNTLWRRAALLRIARALGLSKEINRQDIAQLVLAALDEQQGRTFKALSAGDREAMPKPQVRWLIPGLLPANDLTILGGRPKVGKSCLALTLASAVVKAESVLDRPALAKPRPVVLITDDQGDGDTAEMLERLDLWSNPLLHWSSNFRLNEAEIDALLAVINANPGALVVVDSLRSITRSLPYGENDPEIGAVLYDLKEAVIGAGGTLLLIHHCNKASDLVGIEALSGNTSIAGASNTVLTMHYMPGPKGEPDKVSNERRLVREARSGEPFDVVLNRDPHQGYRVVTDMRAWQEQAKQAAAFQSLSGIQMEVLNAFEPGVQMTRRQICEELEIDWANGKGSGSQKVARALTYLVGVGRLVVSRQGRGDLYELPC